MQRSGSPPPAGVSTAEVMTALGTGKSEGGSVARLAHGFGVTGVAIDVVPVLKPARWPCECPSAQLGPCKRVGSGELPAQFRFPPTLTRLMPEAPCGTLDAPRRCQPSL